MLCYSIANIYFIVLFQKSYSCVCTERNVMKKKGELGSISEYKEKRQLSEEPGYSTTEMVHQTKSFSNESYIGVLDDIELIDESVPPTTITNPDRSTWRILSSITPTEVSLPTGTEIEFVTSISYLNIMKDSDQAPNEISVRDITFKRYAGKPNIKLLVPNILQKMNFDDGIDKVLATPMISKTESPVDCIKLKHTRKLDLDKMADLWRIVYYTIPRPLKCFRIHIKMLTTTDQIHYAKTYGNFHDKIHWDKIRLEILSADYNNPDENRKHFLQSHDSVDSVMKNIIIEENRTARSGIKLISEVSDQWLIIKDLLLMRDCESGDIAMFSRLPFDPKISEIERALEIFGEPRKLLGTLAC